MQIKLYSETMGQGPSSIVLLHGWGMHSGIWQFVATKLSEEFKVILVDLPGFGRSDMIPDYSLEEIVEQLRIVTPPEAHWVGWSLGGLIATRFALAYPSRVKKLILVASSPKFLEADGWPGMKLSVLQKFHEQLKVDYEATLMRFILLQFYGMTLNKKIIRWLNSNLFLYGRPSIQTLDASLNLLESVDLRREIVNLRCPILYLFGKLDALVPIQMLAALNKISGNIRSIIFPKASHALFLSHQDAFLTEVRHFIHE